MKGYKELTEIKNSYGGEVKGGGGGGGGCGLGWKKIRARQELSEKIIHTE